MRLGGSISGTTPEEVPSVDERARRGLRRSFPEEYYFAGASLAGASLDEIRER